jgi:hypothetical protein
MSNNIKIVLTAIVALIVGIVFGAMFAPSSSNLGSVRYTQDKFVYGITAGLTDQLAIDSAGNITTTGTATFGTTTTTGTNMILSGVLAASSTISSDAGISGTTATFTGIATLATSSVTSLCVYNGTNFTKISFASGSTTPAYATSTTCL